MESTMKSLCIIFSFAFAALFSLAPQSASAQNLRSWVAGNGADNGVCTFSNPCATFGGAVAATAAGGTINCANSGSYSTPIGFTISKSITISCRGVAAGVDGAISISAGATDKVVLEGLLIDEHQILGLNAITINSGGFVYLIDSTVQGAAGNGVLLQSTTPNARLFIQNSRIQGNAASGVTVSPAGSTVNILSVIDSLIDSNGPTGIKLTSSGAILGLQRSVLNGSPAAISLSNGANAFTVGGTNSVNGTFSFTGTIPLN
jgi:hypothetical protein